MILELVISSLLYVGIVFAIAYGALGGRADRARAAARWALAVGLPLALSAHGANAHGPLTPDLRPYARAAGLAYLLAVVLLVVVREERRGGGRPPSGPR